MVSVRVDSEDLRVMVEICDMVQGPMEPSEVGVVVRMAAYVTPRLEEAFVLQGLDPDDIELPEFPLLKPGDLHQG